MDHPLCPGLVDAAGCDPDPCGGVVSEFFETSYDFAGDGVSAEYFRGVKISGNTMAGGEAGIGGISFEDSGSEKSGSGVGTLPATGVYSDTGLVAVAVIWISEIRGFERRG